MKALALLSLVSLLTISCSSNKYDKRRLEVQRQEAIDMINNSKDIKIDKGLGKDKIILRDQ
jgi:uncharacterized protein YcfL